MFSINNAVHAMQGGLGIAGKSLQATGTSTGLARSAFSTGSGKTPVAQFLNPLISAGTGLVPATPGVQLRSGEAALLNGAGSLLKTLANLMEQDGPRFSSVGAEQPQSDEAGDIGGLLKSIGALLEAREAQLANSIFNNPLNSQGQTDDADDADDDSGFDSDQTNDAIPDLLSMLTSNSQSAQPPVTSRDQALRSLVRDFDRGSIGNGSSITLAQLKQAATQGNAAARFAVNSGMFSDANGQPLQSISQNNLYARLDTTGNAHGERSAYQTLAENSQALFADGSVSRSQIQQIADGGAMPDGSAASSQMQQVAGKLMNDSAFFDKLDAANLTKSGDFNDARAHDGKFTLQDVLAAMNQSLRGPSETAQASPTTRLPQTLGGLGPAVTLQPPSSLRGSRPSVGQDTRGQAFTRMLADAMTSHAQATGNPVNVLARFAAADLQPLSIA